MIKSHVTQWLHAISSFPPNLVYMFFLKLIIQKIGNTKSGKYYKVITRCDRSLLQSASGITKYDRLLLQSTSGITKCDGYYKVRRNTWETKVEFSRESKGKIGEESVNNCLKERLPIFRDIFWTQSNIYDAVFFFKNSSQLKTIKYFHKKVQS